MAFRPERHKPPHLSLETTKSEDSSTDTDNSLRRESFAETIAAPAIVSFRGTPGHQAPFSEYVVDTATVWSSYLTRAKDLDDRLVQTWMSGLDALLVFAGLFSAILTAFLIEVRKGLQEDLQENTNVLLMNLLSGMNNAAQSNPATSPVFNPTKSAVVINGLWFYSLTFSLISALGAVLAKGWVAQYQRESNGTGWRDARARQLRYHNIVHWRVQDTISLIPIFLHAAFFLFFAGLVVLLFSDNVAIAHAVLILVILTTALYLIITLIPIAFPNCPFKTPISNVFSRSVSQLLLSRALLDMILFPAVAGLYAVASVLFHITFLKIRLFSIHDKLGQYLESCKGRFVTLVKSFPSWGSIRSTIDELRREPPSDDLKAEALAWLLSTATEPDIIQSTVKAIAGMPLSARLQSALQDYGADIILVRGLSECITRSPGMVNTPDEYLAEAYLHALLRLVRLPHDSERPLDVDILLSLVGAKGPLYRWDNLEPRLRVVSYIVQTMVRIRCGLQDLGHNSRLSYRHEMDRLLEAGLHQHHWKVLAETVVIVVKNGGRGERIQAAGVLTRLARHNAAVAQWESGPKAPDRLQDVLANPEILNVFIELIGEADEMLVDEGVQALIELVKHDEIRKKLIEQDVSGHVLKLLAATKPWRMTAGATAISELAKYVDVRTALGLKVRAAPGQDVVGQLFEHLRTTDDNNDPIRSISAKTLSMLAEDHNICSRLVEDIYSKLLPQVDLQTHSVVSDVKAVSELAKHRRFWSKLRQTRPNSMMNIHDWLLAILKNENLQVVGAGLAALPILAMHGYFDLQHILGRLLEILEHSQLPPPDEMPLLAELHVIRNQPVVDASVKTLLKLAVKHKNIRYWLPNDMNTNLLKLLQSKDLKTVISGVEAVAGLAKHKDIIHKVLRGAIPAALLQILARSETKVLIPCINVLPELAKQIGSVQFVQTGIPPFIQLCASTNGVLVRTCMEALVDLMTDKNIRSELLTKDIVIQLLEHLTSANSDIVDASAQALPSLAEYKDVRAMFLSESVCTLLLDLLNHTNVEVGKASIVALASLVRHDDLCSQLLSRDIDSQLIKCLQSGNNDILIVFIEALPNFANHDVILARLLNRNLEAALLDLFESNNSHVTCATLNVLPALAKHSSFRARLLSKSIATQLLELLQSTEDDIVRASAQALSELAQHDDIQAACLKDNIIAKLIGLQQGHGSSDSSSKVGTYGNISAYSVSSVELNSMARLDSQSQSIAALLISGQQLPGKLDGFLLEMLKSTSERVVHASTKALSELAGHDDICNRLLSSDLGAQLLSLLRASDEQSVKAGIKTISELAKHDIIHNMIISQGLDTQLLNLLKGTDINLVNASAKALWALADHSRDYASDLRDQIITQLKEQLQNLSEHKSIACMEAVSELGKHDNISSALLKEQQPTIALLGLLKSENTSTVLSASVKALLALAESTNTGNLRSRIEAQLLELFQSIHHDDDDSLAWAMGMPELAKYGEIWTVLKERLQKWFKRLLSKDPKDLSGAMVVSELSRHSKHLTEFINADMIAQLIESSEHQDTLLVARAQVLQELAKYNIYTRFPHQHTIQWLLKLLQSTNAQVASASARALMEFMEHKDFHSKFTCDGIGKGLLELLKRDEDYVVSVGVEALSKLAKHGDINAKFLHEDIHTQLLNLLDGPNFHIVSASAEALAGLVKHEYVYSKFSHGVIEKQLYKLLESPHPKVVSAGAKAFSELANLQRHSPGSNYDKLFSKGIDAQLRALHKTTDEDIVHPIANTLSELVEHENVRAILLRTEYVSYLLEFLQHKTPSVQAFGAHALSVCAKYRDLRAMIPVMDVTIGFLTAPQARHEEIAPLLCELLSHEDSRIPVLKLHAAHTIFTRLGAEEHLGDLFNIVKEMDSIGVIDKWTNRNSDDSLQDTS